MMPLSRREFLVRGGCACTAFAFGGFDLHALAGPTSTATVTDALVPTQAGAVKIGGFFADRLNLGATKLLEGIEYAKLVDYFRFRKAPVGAGEFWGKMVRASALTYQFTGDAKLKALLNRTVDDLLSTQTADGCISTHPDGHQLCDSDIWERKYVLLGLESYYEIAPGERILQAMVRLANRTIAQVGPPPKVPITDIAYAFDGIESSSILEPMVRLYDLTGNARYLDFARYIVEQAGGCKRGNIFEASFRDVAPRKIGDNGNPAQSIAKGYETLSCFDGLVDYYRATGNDHWKEAALNYYRNVRDQEITLIGGGGGDQPYNHGPGIGEQWNNTALEQTNPAMHQMMETCVTVYWMKFCQNLLRLTGDSTIADQIELSAYNALAGAQKPTGIFYDYFQPLNGQRNGVVNYSQPIGDIPLSCCTANGPTGMALVFETAYMQSNLGPVVNFYLPGTATFWMTSASSAEITVQTDYPKSGCVILDVRPTQGSGAFVLQLRIPAWSKETRLTVNGRDIPAGAGSYAQLDYNWSLGGHIELELDMRCRLIPAPHGSDRKGDNFVALVRGPIVLARDERLPGDILYSVKIKPDADGFVPLTPQETTISQMQFAVPQSDGTSIVVIDYASAGRTWDASSQMVTWLPVA
jgi:DUF1680 family protein